MDNVEEIVLNVDFDRGQPLCSVENEVQVVPSDIQWEDLELMVCMKKFVYQLDRAPCLFDSLKVYADRERITVIYWDDDNDQVQIASQCELMEAFKVARRFHNTLRILVKCSSDKHTDSGQATSTGDRFNSYNTDSNNETKQYFYLKSVSCGNLVLDVQGHGQHEGTQVILWDRKQFDPNFPNFIDNQLWYEDRVTGTIRTVQNDYCLDVNGDRLVVCSYNREKRSQKFAIIGRLIHWQANDNYSVVGVKQGDNCRAGCSPSVGPQVSLIHYEWFKEYTSHVVLTIPTNVQLPLLNSFRRDLVKDIVNSLSSLVNVSDARQEMTDSDSGAFHLGVYCDNCDCNIVGIRYKCGCCDNYDLCSECEKKTPAVHDPSHVLLKMALPAKDVKLNHAVIDRVLARSASQTSTLGARFLRDETIPDGSSVAPGAKLKKKWILYNSGSSTWTPSNTVVRLMTGTMFVNTESALECEAPPGQECCVCAELVAPEQEGCYTSHWRLVNVDTQTAFGPVIWCQINVDQSLAASSCTADATDHTATATITNGVDVALSTEDLFTFVKTLEKTAKKVQGDRPGPLAVPTNTPLAATPLLYTPAAGLSRVSSSGSVSSLGNEDLPPQCNARDLNMAVMANLVYEKMSEFSPPNENGNGDRVSNDQCSDAASSDGSFYVVPIPDCFNMTLPASKTSSTSLIVRKDAGFGFDGKTQSAVVSECSFVMNASSKSPVINTLARSFDSNDSALYSTDIIHSQVEITEHLDIETDAVVITENVADDAEQFTVFHETLEETETAFERLSGNAGLNIEDETSSNDEQVRNENETHNKEGANGEVRVEVKTEFLRDLECQNEVAPNAQICGVNTGEENHDDGDDDDIDGDAHNDNNNNDGDNNEEQTTGAAVSRKPPSKESSLEDMAYGLLASTVENATKIAWGAFHTAKDVFHTLQAKNTYVPKESEWTPKESTWTPGPCTYNPPTDDCVWSQPYWTPPSSDDTAVPATAGPSNPMDVLIDMGFANRSLNAELLRLYGNNVDRVVQELINANEAEWQATRH